MKKKVELMAYVLLMSRRPTFIKSTFFESTFILWIYEYIFLKTFNVRFVTFMSLHRIYIKFCELFPFDMPQQKATSISSCRRHICPQYDTRRTISLCFPSFCRLTKPVHYPKVLIFKTFNRRWWNIEMSCTMPHVMAKSTVWKSSWTTSRKMKSSNLCMLKPMEPLLLSWHVVMDT